MQGNADRIELLAGNRRQARMLCLHEGLRSNDVTWSRGCDGDTAVGRGVLRSWTEEDSGELVQGKKHGHWVDRWDPIGSSHVEEGPYVDGERHGHWVKTSVPMLRQSSGKGDQ